jgi:hypothetical protein
MRHRLGRRRSLLKDVSLDCLAVLLFKDAYRVRHHILDRIVSDHITKIEWEHSPPCWPP